MSTTDNRFYREAESLPTTLSEERVKELKELYAECQKSPPQIEARKMVETPWIFLAKVYDAFPALLHTAEMVQQFKSALDDIQKWAEDALTSDLVSGEVEDAFEQIERRASKALPPPAPETKGGAMRESTEDRAEFERAARYWEFTDFTRHPNGDYKDLKLQFAWVSDAALKTFRDTNEAREVQQPFKPSTKGGESKTAKKDAGWAICESCGTRDWLVSHEPNPGLCAKCVAKEGGAA